MIRFLFRCLSTVALAIGVVMAVLDATRTVAASTLVMTPLGTSWAAASPDTMEQARAFVTQKLGAALWDPMLTSILALPGFVVFAGVSLILYVIGRKPARRHGGFALEA
jgi:hypothetical protein